MSLLGVLIMVSVWRWSVGHLYTLSPDALWPFVSITEATVYSVAAIVSVMVTGKAILEARSGDYGGKPTPARPEVTNDEQI